MKVKYLFAAYDQHITAIPNSAAIFEQSGMVNEFGKLDFGFFPLGSGILTDKSKIEEAEIETCHIMILGNDFGTQDYVENKCPDKKEKKTNSTIKNLFSLDLKAEKTFFTNF